MPFFNAWKYRPRIKKEVSLLIIGGKVLFSLEKIIDSIDAGECDSHRKQVRDAYAAITEGGRSIEDLDSLVKDDILEEIAMNLELLFRERYSNSVVLKFMEAIDGAPRIRERRELFLTRFFCLPEMIRKEVRSCA